MVDGVNIAQMLKDVNAIKQGRQTTEMNQMKIGQAETGIQKQKNIASLLPAAVGGDTQALTDVAKLDPETASGIQKYLQTASDAEKADLDNRVGLMGKLGLFVLQSPDKAAAYSQALAQAQQAGVDTSTFPQQYTPEVDVQLNGMVAQASEIKNMIGGGSEFGQLTKDMAPEDVEKARRVKLGLDPRAITAAPRPIMIGDVPHVFDPATKSMVPVEVAGQQVTAETVGESKATIADLVERGKGSGKLVADTIKEATAGITKIRKNTLNVDKAISALDRGATTGFVAQYFPSIRSASIELDQIQSELGLDVVGAVTFGALSKGELDLALDVALPKGLSPPDLKDWLLRKKDAQEELSEYFESQINFLEGGGKLSEFRALMQEQAAPQEAASDVSGLLDKYAPKGQ